MSTTCIFCGGACGRVCRGLGFKTDGDTQTRNSVPSKSKNKIVEAAREAVAIARGESEPARVTVVPRGRPLAKDAATALMQTKPWISEGMSRASWYRRQKMKS